MPELSGCPSCQGFNPPSTTACLHCGNALASSPPRRSAAAFWVLAGAGVAALTLMACYGAPPCDDGMYDCYNPDPSEDGGVTDGGTDAGR